MALILKLQNEIGKLGRVLVELLAGGGAGGAGLAAFGEYAAGEEGVGASVVGDNVEIGGEGAIYADAEEMGPAGNEAAEVLEAQVPVGASVEALPAEGGGGYFEEA